MFVNIDKLKYEITGERHDGLRKVLALAPHTYTTLRWFVKRNLLLQILKLLQYPK